MPKLPSEVSNCWSPTTSTCRPASPTRETSSRSWATYSTTPSMRRPEVSLPAGYGLTRPPSWLRTALARRSRSESLTAVRVCPRNTPDARSTTGMVDQAPGLRPAARTGPRARACGAGRASQPRIPRDHQRRRRHLHGAPSEPTVSSADGGAEPGAPREPRHRMTARSFVRTSANESVYTMNTRVTGVTTCRMLPIGSSPGPFLVLREQQHL